MNNKSYALKSKIYQVIFETDTASGRFFDVALICCILLSVACAMLESVASINAQYGGILRSSEWAFTIVFTIEYLLRIYASRKPRAYIFSFFGIVDLLAIIPTYLSLIISGSHYLLVVRIIRLLRIFRVLKLIRHVGEAQVLMAALRASAPKITVFIGAVCTLIVIIGSLMYLVEGPSYGFTSIPTSMYWAVVTLTTVGYGDITPHTILGQIMAAIVMIMGYSIIAVPTGIVSVELSRFKDVESQKRCAACLKFIQDSDAVFCKYCGEKLIK